MCAGERERTRGGGSPARVPVCVWARARSSISRTDLWFERFNVSELDVLVFSCWSVNSLLQEPLCVRACAHAASHIIHLAFPE